MGQSDNVLGIVIFLGVVLMVIMVGSVILKSLNDACTEECCNQSGGTMVLNITNNISEEIGTPNFICSVPVNISQCNITLINGYWGQR